MRLPANVEMVKQMNHLALTEGLLKDLTKVDIFFMAFCLIYCCSHSNSYVYFHKLAFRSQSYHRIVRMAEDNNKHLMDLEWKENDWKFQLGHVNNQTAKLTKLAKEQ